MATSTNYLWAEPDDTSLVKNGALAIRTLGNAIDTSLWNSGFGQAGKNKIINGDFAINQRAFVSTTTNNDYGFDRMRLRATDGTVTYSAQTFTAGAAPVAGYESTNYARIVTTGQTNATTAAAMLRQTIEDVRTFAGQTITISFWAKAATGTPYMNAYVTQSFGSGGSTAVSTNVTKQAVTTAWARYSFTIAVPSVSGKTIGAGSYLLVSLVCSAGTSFLADSFVQNNTFDMWGWQVEYGSYATPFQTASGGSPQGELAMCQRYYWRSTSTSGNNQLYAMGFASGTTGISGPLPLPVQMRVIPTSIGYSNVRATDENTNIAISALVANNRTTPNVVYLAATVTGATQFRPYVFVGNDTAGYLEVSAEL